MVGKGNSCHASFIDLVKEGGGKFFPEFFLDLGVFVVDALFSLFSCLHAALGRDSFLFVLSVWWRLLFLLLSFREVFVFRLPPRTACYM